MSRTLVAVSLAGALLASPAAQASFEAKVVEIVDGDTVVIKNGKKLMRVNLLDVDCPEMSQPFGARARHYTASFALRKVVRLVPADAKQDRKKLEDNAAMEAELFLGRRSLNAALLAAGLAWLPPKPGIGAGLVRLARDAQKAKRGLWVQRRPEAPWSWRQRGAKYSARPDCYDACLRRDSAKELTWDKLTQRCRRRCGIPEPPEDKTKRPEPAKRRKGVRKPEPRPRRSARRGSRRHASGPVAAKGKTRPEVEVLRGDRIDKRKLLPSADARKPTR